MFCPLLICQIIKAQQTNQIQPEVIFRVTVDSSEMIKTLLFVLKKKRKKNIDESLQEYPKCSNWPMNFVNFVIFRSGQNIALLNPSWTFLNLANSKRAIFRWISLEGFKLKIEIVLCRRDALVTFELNWRSLLCFNESQINQSAVLRFWTKILIN